MVLSNWAPLDFIRDYNLDKAGIMASITAVSCENREAGAPRAEIEITAEMIEAGLYQFLREYPETGTGDELDRRMVVAIFKAMQSVAS